MAALSRIWVRPVVVGWRRLLATAAAVWSRQLAAAVAGYLVVEGDGATTVCGGGAATAAVTVEAVATLAAGKDRVRGEDGDGEVAECSTAAAAVVVTVAVIRGMAASDGLPRAWETVASGRRGIVGWR
uniref:DUF834 domain-containing protein n=1 Tax=Oryza rufipogon TaxID=4529 RepID=A0A0E0NIQ7_ORYRU